MKPVYVHFPLNAGGGSLRATDWGRMEDALAQTETPLVNVHLQARTQDFPDMPADTTEPTHVRRILDALVQDVALVTAKFGPERVIVENVVYRGADGKLLLPCIDPDVICQVVEETGCGLLLDLAHAWLTCLALGLETREYVARLPVARLRELHVTGAQPHEGRLRDSMAMGQEDWALVEWAMKRIGDGQWGKPWVTAFEYGGVGPGFEWRSEASVIAEQVPRLRKLTAEV